MATNLPGGSRQGELAWSLAWLAAADRAKWPLTCLAAACLLQA